MRYNFIILLCSFNFILGCSKQKTDILTLLASNNQKDRETAAYLIAEKGVPDDIEINKVVSLLLPSLSSPRLTLKCNTIAALKKIGPPAKQAVPPLIRLLKHKEKKVKGNAVLALGKIQSNLEITIPAIINVIETNDEIKWHAIKALGSVGSKAKETIPYLEKLLAKTSDKDIKVELRLTLYKITGDKKYTTIEEVIMVEGAKNSSE